MILSERAIEARRPITLIGAQPGALLAGIPLLLAARERGVEVALSALEEDPLTRALARTLAARGLPHAIAIDPAPAGLAAPIAIGDGALLDAPIARALAARDDALLAIVGIGAEACAGIDPAIAARRLVGCLAEGSLVDRTILLPFDPRVRAWLEIVEDVHHAVGPAEQRPIVDTVRAALMGRHGAIAVDLAARERRAHVSLESAQIAWLRPARMHPDHARE